MEFEKQKNQDSTDTPLIIDGVVKRSGTLALSWGKFGGFYFHWRYTKRICLGWLAITYIPDDLDNLLSKE